MITLSNNTKSLALLHQVVEISQVILNWGRFSIGDSTVLTYGPQNITSLHQPISYQVLWKRSKTLVASELMRPRSKSNMFPISINFHTLSPMGIAKLLVSVT